MKRTTIQDYVDLLDNLMDYTDFESTDQIQTKKDLNDFLDQVKDHSKSKGYTFRASKKLRNRLVDAMEYLQEKELKIIRRTKGELKPIKSLKQFESPREAVREGAAIIEKGHYIYAISLKQKWRARIKGKIVTKEKSVIRFRDERGRFVKTKEE